MKILNLKIKDPLGKEIRNIEFKDKGISFIYGDIQEPKNTVATINSLGKTLLLKFIDYIFGANEDANIVKEVIHKYVLDAVVLFEKREYRIKRTLGSSEYIYIEDVPYTLTDYKNHFGIKRSLYSKQFIIRKKSTEISYNSNPNKEDVSSYLELLHLSDLLGVVDDIYNSQDKIADYKKNKKELIAFYGDFDIKQIDEEIYFVDKEVKRLSKELEKISEKIRSIEISEIQQNVIEEYAEKGKQLKGYKREYENKRVESERLIEFLDDSNKIDFSSEHILAIYTKAKHEVPEMVKKNIQEVEDFYKKVYDERKEFLNSKRENIQKEMSLLQLSIENLAVEIDRIGKIISMNEIYQESIGLYEKYNRDLQELKYKEGKLSQVKNIDSKIDNEDSKLSTNFNNAYNLRKKYDDLVQSYRDYIYNITKKIYDDEVNSYFDIKVRAKHLKNRPIVFEFSLKGDTGEGVNEVKKNLMDFLVCRFSTYTEMMLQDSACYNGIDPRQVAGMIMELVNLTEITEKQCIVSINKYQIGDNSEVINYIENNSSIILSEKDKLLKFDF